MAWVKLAHGDEIRRISLPVPATFESLAAAVKANYHLPRRGSRLTYVDADGDAVAIHDDDSLAFAMETAGEGKTLKITVTAVDRERGRRKSSPAPPAAPTAAPAAGAGAPFSPPTAALPGTWAGGAFYPTAAAPPAAPAAPSVPALPFFGLPFFPNPPHAAALAAGMPLPLHMDDFADMAPALATPLLIAASSTMLPISMSATQHVDAASTLDITRIIAIVGAEACNAAFALALVQLLHAGNPVATITLGV
jgi:hypothetical protein